MTEKNKVKPHRSARSLMVTLVLAFVGLSAVALLISSALQLFTNVQTQQQAVLDRQRLIAQGASKDVSTFVEDKFDLLESTVELTELSTLSIKEQKTVLESVLGYQPAFSQIVLLNALGKQSAWDARTSLALTEQFTSQIREEILALGKAEESQRYISPIYIDDNTSEPLVVLAIPVTDLLGNFKGTLVAELNLKFMWDLVDRLKVGETGYAYVVDDQGNLIAFRDTALVLRGENVAYLDEVAEFVTRENPDEELGENTIPISAGILGNDVVASYAPLDPVTWAVVVELPVREAYSEIIFLGIWALVITVGAAIVAGLTGIYLARRLAAPIIDLSNIATEVGSGNLSLHAQVVGPSEIRSLAAAFNDMTTQLSDSIGSLEQRVADRTKALVTSAEVSRHLAAILDPRQLAHEVVNEVRNAFDYYYAQIYLLDEADKNLVIAGGTGEAGAAMLASGHKVPKGRGLVGRAADANASVLVPDVAQEEGWLPNELLPETKAEAAIPISIGNQVLGVLDVQHNVVNGLAPEDVTLLESLASQVAISLQNARSYTQSRKQAELETLVNTIGQKIQRTTSVEDTLQTAVREIGVAIGATRVKAHIAGKSQD